MKSNNTQTERPRSRFGNKEFRTLLASRLSLLATAVFAGYNVFLWIVYRAAWNIGIAVYYALLSALRGYALLAERRLGKLCEEGREPDGAAKKLFLLQSLFLFLIALALIVPISLMVMQKKTVQYSPIPAIATAAYTTYKVAFSTRNFIKSRKEPRGGIKILRCLNFVDALVSVLSLQYVLVMTFGSGVEGSMLSLCAVTSFTVWTVILAISVAALVRAVAKRK